MIPTILLLHIGDVTMEANITWLGLTPQGYDRVQLRSSYTADGGQGCQGRTQTLGGLGVTSDYEQQDPFGKLLTAYSRLNTPPFIIDVTACLYTKSVLLSFLAPNLSMFIEIYYW